MVHEIEQVLNMTCMYMHELENFEEIDRPLALTPPKPSIEEAPKLELKPWTSDLCYAYLRNFKPLRSSSHLVYLSYRKTSCCEYFEHISELYG